MFKTRIAEMKYSPDLKIGTCSWKYGSWMGLVYSAQKGINFLQEYAASFNTVEIDQWFWSLFEGSPPAMPKAPVVAEYCQAVPRDFRFSVKVPNSITLTHYYRKGRSGPLVANPFFFSPDLMQSFLSKLEPMRPMLGPLMFQFEYLNRQKMPSQQQFQTRFGDFAKLIPDDYQYAVEIRNPNYLNRSFFDFLNANKLSPVFLQGYYMPSIVEVFRNLLPVILENKLVVIRLHGPNRERIEKKASGNWSALIEPKDEELDRVIEIIRELQQAKADVYLNVNNHYEGCAPLTIRRIERRLAGGLATD